MTARVSRIQEQLVQAWDVLATLTPADYLAFRDLLGPASGFQSPQYRRLEFAAGQPRCPQARGVPASTGAAGRARGRAPATVALRRGDPAAGAARLAIDEAVLARDVARRYRSDPRCCDAWAEVYRRSGELFDLYELAEELLDLEDAFRQWRFRHVTTVERIIGHKPGTGGTAGVAYLRSASTMSCSPSCGRSGRSSRSLSE